MRRFPFRRLLSFALALVAGLVWHDPAAAAEDLRLQTEEGELIAPNPLDQPIEVLPPTPWLAARADDGIAYFVFTSSPRIERYDLVARAWLSTIALAETPTAFHVDEDGLYVGFGRRTSAFALDGTAERHMRNTNYDARELCTLGDFLVISDDSFYYSINKNTGVTIDTTIDDWNFGYSMRGVTGAASLRRMFGRTGNVSPADILYVQLAADGTLVTQEDSPYHGDYNGAERTWLYPGEAIVIDNSGIGYFTGDLTYAGSFGGAFEDAAFDGTTAILLRAGVLHAYSQGFRTEGQYTLAAAAKAIFTSEESVFAFGWDGLALTVEEVLLSQLSVPAPGAPVDPNGLEYVPDAIAWDGADLVYLLSRGSLSVFRWSLSNRAYLSTIPLVRAPSLMALSTVNQRLYLGYAGGELTQVSLATGVEGPFVNLPQSPTGLATAGEFVFANDASGAWDSHYVFSPGGTLLAQREWNYYSREYTWSPANRRMYFFRDHFSPNDIHWEEIQAGGALGAQGESPYHSGAGIEVPIRVAPDASLVLLGSGWLYDGSSLAQVNALSNDVDDAVWNGTTLRTLREFGPESQIQVWGPSYSVIDSAEFAGAPLRLFTDQARLLLVTLEAGKPRFTVIDLSLEPSADIFSNGFETGTLGAWLVESP